jgi:glutaredoxin
MTREYIVFGRKTCPWTVKALEKLENSDYSYSFVEVDGLSKEQLGEAFAGIASENGHKTFPCVFAIEFVGGHDALVDELK